MPHNQKRLFKRIPQMAVKARVTKPISGVVNISAFLVFIAEVLPNNSLNAMHVSTYIYR